MRLTIAIGLLLATCGSTGCGSGSRSYAKPGYADGDEAYAQSESVEAQSGDVPGEARRIGSETELLDCAVVEPTDMMIAARPDDENGAGGGQPQGGGGAGDGDSGGSSDSGPKTQPGRSTPLLIYQATMTLGVFEVELTQDRLIGEVKGLGGFLSRRSDTELVLRVPATRFEEALAKVEDAGDVLARNVEALDVTEEFRDLTIRLKNAEAMRARLEVLLEKADDVEAALAVEKQLGRVTEQIELLKGRLRYLEDRLAYSTITIRFSPVPSEDLGELDAFRLPFWWLDDLGLQRLLDLR